MESSKNCNSEELSGFTLGLIKPEAVRAGLVPDIIKELKHHGG